MNPKLLFPVKILGIWFSAFVFVFIALPLYKSAWRSIKPILDQPLIVSNGGTLYGNGEINNPITTAPPATFSEKYFTDSATDTISGSETVYLYPGEVSPGRLQVVIQTDSLSGATSGEVYLEYGAGDVWYLNQQFHLNGSTTQIFHFDDKQFEFPKFRIRAVANRSTQSTRIRAAYVNGNYASS